MVEAVGAMRGDETIEAMLAEGLGALLASHPDIDLPATLGGALDVDGAEARAFRLELGALRGRAEAAVEAMRPNDDVVPPATLVVTWPDPDDPTAPAQIDRQLRSLAATLAMRDIELGELACAIVDHEAWRMFGYASFDHHCRERIGLAPWIERATQRTVKQIREDIDATELLARLEGRSPCTFTPPDADILDAVDDVERSVIAAITGLTETPASQTSGDLSAPTPEAGPTTLHLSLTESTGHLMASRGQRATRRVGSSSTHRTSPGGALTFALGFWRALDRLHGQMSGGAPFVPFLVRAVLDTWRDTTAGQVAYADVYLRDRWRCASPVCRSRNVTPHHIRFRSHGGGEERTNLISLCERCHLELVHHHKLRVSGHAPNGLTWQASGWASGRALAASAPSS